jgi:preprotein translocase subunit SecF
MYRIIQTRKWWVGISCVLVAASVVVLLTRGLSLGLDFTGGSLLEVRYTVERPDIEAVRRSLEPVELVNLSIQPSDSDRYLLRAATMDEATHQAALAALRGDAPESVDELRFDSVGPTIGAELQRKAVWAILGVILAIIFYLTYVFRGITKPVPAFQYGLAAAVALIHDVTISLGAFAFVAHYTGWQADSLLVTALLTLLGFSVHDTIVTFDRLRENLRHHTPGTFEDVVNTSINQTIVRSLNTSLTTLFVAVAIMLFGGASVRPLAFVMSVGIIVGSYSSIFVASPVLLWASRRYLKPR